MRRTLHLVAAADLPAFAQLSRQAWLRSWRGRHADLDEERVLAELGAWLRAPRTNAEIAERACGLLETPAHGYEGILAVRYLLALVQLPPAGFRRETGRPRFVVDPRPRPDPAAAAALVARRYLAAFGPASRADAAAWAGVAQRDLAPAWERLALRRYADERGHELLDLPRAPVLPAGTRLPARLLARWDQPLLAYADRERILPAELLPLRLVLSGDATGTVDGRVAARWEILRSARRVEIRCEPLVALSRPARAALRAEGERAGRFAEPGADGVRVTGL